MEILPFLSNQKEKLWATINSRLLILKYLKFVDYSPLRNLFMREKTPELRTDGELTSLILQQNGLYQLNHYIPSLSQYSQFVLLTHPRLMELYGSFLMTALQKFQRPILSLLIPEGEKSKNLKQAMYCWQHMIDQQVDRQTALIAFGGGVICDLAGFVASCYMRGIDSFYLPTTLLAMVDAALGGKTGINLAQNKNIIGTFHHPQFIFIDPSVLKTLPTREWNSGLAEIIKYGIIEDFFLFEELEDKIEGLQTGEIFFLEKVIQRCLNLKSQLIHEDIKDQTGKRAILNYGHTFAHAIEVLTKYKRYLHGEAVSIGMSCAAHVGAKLGLCDFSLVERQDRLCQRVNLPTRLPNHLAIDDLITIMRSDKKAICGKINLILPERIGRVIKVDDVDSTLIRSVLLDLLRH